MAPAYYLDGEWCLRPFLLLLESWLGVALLSRRGPTNSTSPANSGATSPSMGMTNSSIVNINTYGAGEEGGEGLSKGEDDWVVQWILRGVSALFVLNIALSLINLART
jgi:hypothetical protein